MSKKFGKDGIFVHDTDLFTAQEIHTALSEYLHDLLGNRSGVEGIELGASIARMIHDGTLFVCGIKEGNFVFGSKQYCPWKSGENT